MFFSIVVDVVNACGGEGEQDSTIQLQRSLSYTISKMHNILIDFIIIVTITYIVREVTV